MGSRLKLFNREGVFHPYWDAVIRQLTAIPTADLLEQLIPDYLDGLAGIVSLHRYPPPPSLPSAEFAPRFGVVIATLTGPNRIVKVP